MDLFVRRARCCLLTGFLLTAGAGLLSDGVYHEDDLNHYLFARWSWHDARYLLDAWARPGFTVPYALPAAIGSAATSWHACRLASALLTAATAWLAYRIARRLRLRHAWLAVPLVYLQPLATHLSLTTLTETTLAFYVALATWLLLTNRLTASAAVIALAPVTRPDAIILLVIWVPALWRARAGWLAYPALCWAVVTHNVLSAVFLGVTPFHTFFEPGGSTQYGRGTPLSFVPAYLLAAGPVVVALAVMGARRLVRRTGGWVIVAAPAAYFLTHTLVYAWGAYSSGGYARFLVPTAPFVAVLAAAGAGLILTRRPAIRRRAVLATGALCILAWALCEIEWWWRPPDLSQRWHDVAALGRMATAGLAVCCLGALLCIRQARVPLAARPPVGHLLAKGLLAVMAVGVTFAGPLWAIVPLRLKAQHRIIQEAAEMLKLPRWSDRPVIAINYWVYYFSDRWVPQSTLPVAIESRNGLAGLHGQLGQHTREGTGALPCDASLLQRLANAEPGTLFFWDARFCPEPDYNLSLQTMRSQRDWREVWPGRPKSSAHAPFMVIFERVAMSYP